jgi:acetoin utilization deacetylase AcuC-like enzyme
MLHSDSYRAMTTRMVKVADELCGGRLAVVHEGGYSEAYVPFCGLALLEALSGLRTEVVDPELGFFVPQQPDERMLAFHFELIEEMRAGAGL